MLKGYINQHWWRYNAFAEDRRTKCVEEIACVLISSCSLKVGKIRMYKVCIN